MGMMVGFSILMMFCMKNMPDTEELKKEQEALKEKVGATTGGAKKKVK